MNGSFLYRHPVTRFAIVGCVNFVVSFTVFYLAYHYLPPALRLHAPAAAAANVFCYVAGMINSFLLNRVWTFRADGNATVQLQAFRFVIVNLLSLGVSTFAMYELVDVLGLPELAVWVPATVVAIVMNYLGCKHWAFAPAPPLPSTHSR